MKAVSYKSLENIDTGELPTAHHVMTKLRRTRLGSEEAMPSFTDEPKLPSFLCFPTERAKRKYHVGDLIGQGSGFQELTARVRAYAELIERICLMNPNRGTFKKGSYNDLYGIYNVVDPAIFDCYSDSQVSDVNKREIALHNEVFTWCQATQLAPHHQNVLLPAQLVYLTKELVREYQIRREGISTGAALGDSNSELALCSGILECLERDACIGAWLGANAVTRITNLSSQVQALRDYADRYWLDLRLLNVTSDIGVPSALVFCIDRTGIGPALTSGARSSFSLEGALIGAIKEALQPRRATRFLTSMRGDIKVTSDPIDIESIFERFNYWSDLTRLNSIEEWLRNTASTESNFSECKIVDPASYKSIISIFSQRNMCLYVSDISIDEMVINGLTCIKTISPDLHALHLAEKAISLYSPHYGRINSSANSLPHPIT